MSDNFRHNWRKMMLNRSTGPAVEIINNVGSDAVIRIHDVIGDPWAETTSLDIAGRIDAIDSPTITVSINSPGGNVFDGIAIYNALRAHGAAVTTRVEGIAGSIASVIAQAGDTRQMMGGSQMMIHNPWGVQMGSASDMRKFADVLDFQTGVIAGIYAEHSGADIEDVLSAMESETWYSANDAVNAKLADEVIGSATKLNNKTVAGSDDSLDRLNLVL